MDVIGIWDRIVPLTTGFCVCNACYGDECSFVIEEVEISAVSEKVLSIGPSMVEFGGRKFGLNVDWLVVSNIFYFP